MQKTNFNFEIIIHDDSSDDNTAEIIESYLKNNKNITFIKQKENQYNKVGIARVFTDYTFPLCKGKYIALCEGDDYWTDPYKLQKQVDFLEKNNEYIMCSHGVQIVDEEFNNIKVFNKPGIYNRFKVLENYSISTLSVVFRNNIIKLPDWYYLSKAGDYNLFLLLLGKGLLYSMDEIMGVHIAHKEGIWSLKTNEYKSNIIYDNYKLILENLTLTVSEKSHVENKLLDLQKNIDYINNPFVSILKGKISIAYYLNKKIQQAKQFLYVYLFDR